MESTEYGYFWMLSGGTWWNLFTRVISSSCRRQVAPPDRQICGLGFNGSHLSVAGILEPRSGRLLRTVAPDFKNLQETV